MAKPRPPKTTSDIELPPKRNNVVIITFIAIIVLLAGVAALFVATNGDSSDDDIADASPYRPVTVTGTPLANQPDSGADPTIGTVAPTLVGSTFTGSPVKIEPDGKPKAIGFYAHWCPHCQKELPLVADWLRANRTKYKVDFYAIATATSPNRPNFPPARWFKNEKYSLPVMADDNQASAAAAYGLSSYPYFVFLDGNNKVVARTDGEISMEDFERYVKQAAETSSSTTTTSSTIAAK